MERQKRILVVDGDQYERIMCRVIFQGKEFEVFAKETREEAVEMISKADFDLIISSIRLPDVHGGLTFVQEARMLQREAAVVVTSDRPSVWDAREAVRLGAFKYVVKPLVPEFMRHVARKAFDKRGWIVRKAHIEEFRNYRTPSTGADTPTIYYKNGAWAMHLKEALWEVGYDMKYWPAADQIAHIQVPGGLSSLSAGKPYAKVVSSTGEANELIAPMTGTVEEINGDANDIMLSHAPERLGEDWPLWLARIQTPEVFAAPPREETCDV